MKHAVNGGNDVDSAQQDTDRDCVDTGVTAMAVHYTLHDQGHGTVIQQRGLKASSSHHRLDY